MSNVGLPLIQDFLEQFLSPENPGQTGRGNRTLFQGVVKSQDAITKKVTVTVAGGDIKVAPLTSRTYVAGEYVWGVQENAVRILLGVLGKEGGGGGSSRLIGWARVSAATGGASLGLYGGGYGAGSGAVTIGTSQTSLGLGCAYIPVTPGDMLRIRFKFYAAGPPNTSNEWYFILSMRENGGAWYRAGEVRHLPVGNNAPSPMGEFLYEVPAGTTYIECGIDAYVLTGTGTVHRYNTGYEPGQSIFTVESLGPSQPPPLPVPSVTPTTAMVKIAEAEVTSANSTTFSFNIPAGATYKQLELRFSFWASTAATGTGLYLRFNNDTSSSYQGQNGYFTGTTAGAARYGGVTQLLVGDASPTQSQPSSGVIHLDGALNPAIATSTRAHIMGVYPGTGLLENITVGMWVKTDVVTSIQFLNGNGHNWGAGSWVRLYGLT